MSDEKTTTYEVVGPAPFGPDAGYASVQYPCTNPDLNALLEENRDLRNDLHRAEQVLREIAGGFHSSRAHEVRPVPEGCGPCIAKAYLKAAGAQR